MSARAQYDGGPRDSRLLTMILYVNEGWRREDGGELMLYDAGGAAGSQGEGKCWRTVLPCAGTLVIFRSGAHPPVVYLQWYTRTSGADVWRLRCSCSETRECDTPCVRWPPRIPSHSRARR